MVDNNEYTAIRKLFTKQPKQDNKFNKQLYDSDIIQDILDRLLKLEDQQQQQDNKDKEVHKFGV